VSASGEAAAIVAATGGPAAVDEEDRDRHRGHRGETEEEQRAGLAAGAEGVEEAEDVDAEVARCAWRQSLGPSAGG
jgi:hypothetical protein